MHPIHIAFDFFKDSELLRYLVTLHDCGCVVGHETEAVSTELRVHASGVLNEVGREHVEDE